MKYSIIRLQNICILVNICQSVFEKFSTHEYIWRAYTRQMLKNQSFVKLKTNKSNHIYIFFFRNILFYYVNNLFVLYCLFQQVYLDSFINHGRFQKLYLLRFWKEFILIHKIMEWVYFVFWNVLSFNITFIWMRLQ
jgi:hypothetical protein